MMSGPKAGNEPYRIAYLDCNEPANDPSKPYISIPYVLRNGYVAKNRCNQKVQPTPKPGEVIYLAQPKRWWQIDFQ